MSGGDGFLRLFVGGRRIELPLFDEHGNPSDLDDVDQAHVVVRADAASTPIIDESISGGGVTKESGRLVVMLSQAEADALVPNSYLGQVAMRKTAGYWLWTDAFEVRVETPVAGVLP